MSSALEFLCNAVIPFVVGIIVGALLTLKITSDELKKINKGEREHVEPSSELDSSQCNDQ